MEVTTEAEEAAPSSFPTPSPCSSPQQFHSAELADSVDSEELTLLPDMTMKMREFWEEMDVSAKSASQLLCNQKLFIPSRISALCRR